MVRDLLLAAILGVFISPAASAASPLKAGDQGTPLCGDCNIILISLDALQAAHVHSLAHPRSVTPALDALAGKGRLFTQAISPVYSDQCKP